jgi:NIMA (never in mitosis gene a)-related kinase
MELADRGDLQAQIKNAKKSGQYVKELKIWEVFYQLLLGLAALHKHGIVHRDLKSANVFLFRDGQVKLGDMNVSKVAENSMMVTKTGTPFYCPPELWMEQPYSSKCDIWSLGCVIYELAALSPPFKANNIKQLAMRVNRGVFPNLPPHYSRELQSLIRMCLTVDQRLRPSAENLLELKQFKIMDPMPHLDVDRRRGGISNEHLMKNLQE